MWVAPKSSPRGTDHMIDPLCIFPQRRTMQKQELKETYSLRTPQGPREITQKKKALATNPGDPNSNLGTHTVVGVASLKLFCDFHMYGLPLPQHTSTNKQYISRCLKTGITTDQDTVPANMDRGGVLLSLILGWAKVPSF